MQNLLRHRNRSPVVSIKFLNSQLNYGAGKYTIFGAPFTTIGSNCKANRLLIPVSCNTYRVLRKELSVLHSLLTQNGHARTFNFPKLFSPRYFSTSSASGNKSSDEKSSGQKDDSKKDSGKKPENNDEDIEKLMLLQKAFTFIMLLFAIRLSVKFLRGETTEHEVGVTSWHEFIYHMLVKGEVEEIIIEPNNKRAIIVLCDGAIINGAKTVSKRYVLNLPNLDNFEDKVRKVEKDMGIKFGEGVQIIYDHNEEYVNAALYFLILMGIMAFIGYMAFKSLPTKFDISSHLRAAKFTLVEPFTGKGVRFEDVAGLKEAKIEVMEFVDYLKHPDRYKTLGAKVPKGALLLGPPGCGKTLLAKAVATESNVPFLSMNGSEFIEMLGGLGAARVRSLFAEARRRAPSIIYIDEIDAIGRKRSGGAVEFSNSETERTLNQLLVEMDGMTSRQDIIILASTNRADVLDKALLRPGRFDRHILIDLPTLEERKQIFENHLKALSLDAKPSKYSGYLAYLTPGFSGADIANVCNEAALHAARDQKKQVAGSDLMYAIDRTIGGMKKKTNTLTPSMKKVVAYHEAGHAIVGWLLEHTDALLKVTIVPRTNLSLGFAQYNQTDQKLHSKEELFQRMCMMLGGRVAEYIEFNKISTGAENDLKKVTAVAYHQVQQYGMSDAVGLLSFDEQVTSAKNKKPYSKRLANVMDAEVRRIIGEAYKSTEKLLLDNKDKLTTLAEALLQRETLNYDDVEKLIGPPPFGKKRLVEPSEFEKSMNQPETRTPEPSPA